MLLSLLSYQKKAINKLKEIDKCFLFMSCGTGKTFTALKYAEGMRVLVLAPPRIVKEKVWEKEAANVELLSLTTVSLYNVKDIAAIKPNDYDIMIVDECHRIKSPTAKVSKRVKNLSLKIPKVLGLTGTWVSNGYWDVWGMARSLGIPMFGQTSKNAFLNEYYYTHSLPGLPYVQIPYKMRENTDIFERIEKYSFLYVEEYSDYEETIIHCQGDKSKEYALAQEGILEDNVLTALSKVNYLRQLSNGFYYNDDKEPIEVDDVKRSKFYEVYTDLKIKGKRVIVVYTFTADAEALVLAEGDITLQESAAEGLNLQEYDTVIFYNPTYSFQNYEQARKRILRLGQDKKCTIITLVRQATIEENVLRKRDKKIDASELLVDYLEDLKNE